MTWVDYMSARQLLAEEFVGVPMRQEQRSEIAKVESTKAAIKKREAMSGPR